MIEKLEEYAKKYSVPIIEKDGLDFLINYIRANNIKSILEIGTAIGYSSICIALLNKDIRITTVEKDTKMYEEAIKNINNFNLQNQIEIVSKDALEYTPNNKYDLIFIDAAKSQYIKFFERFSPFLNPNGTIITDNLKFHGLVEDSSNITSKNLKALVRKIRNYVEYLKENKDYKTEFFDIGDGIAVTKNESSN